MTKPNRVLKLPINLDGIDANRYEARSHDIPFMNCRLLQFNKSGYNILYGERLDTSVLRIKDWPDWAWWIDSGQIGKDSKGRIKAYDI